MLARDRHGGAADALDALAWGGTPTGAPLPEPEPLFPRIDKEAYLRRGRERRPQRPGPTARRGARRAMISIDQFFETELKVGTVTAAERVPKSDKLIKLAVDLGEEPRTVVAGIGKPTRPRSWWASRSWWSPTCSRRS